MEKETNTLNARIKAQQSICDRNRKLLKKLTDDLFVLETEPECKALIGKCFRYRNSCGKKEEGWWLYTKVLSYNPKDKQLTLLRFEWKSCGTIEIQPKNERFISNPLTDYILEEPITIAEFNAELAKIKKLINKL